ncbi:MAG TPA: SRPBCC family protein [Saprospiraceae bacterium]|nr:SRPBCC family protein [Saprospiraceae bacterium]
MKKLLKRAGYGLLGLFVILLGISFLLPSEQRIESSVKINAPIQIVFDQVNDLRNWDRWSPWKKMDPMIEMSYSNPPTGKGAFYVWKSKHERVGNGKLILSEVIPNKKIVTALDFEKGQDGSAEFTFEEEKKAVKVTWSMMYHIGGNPVRKYALLFQKGAMRKAFEQGLNGIRENSEKR